MLWEDVTLSQHSGHQCRGLTDASKNVRLPAVVWLTDQAALARIATTGGDFPLRRAAIRKLTDQAGTEACGWLRWRESPTKRLCPRLRETLRIRAFRKLAEMNLNQQTSLLQLAKDRGSETALGNREVEEAGAVASRGRPKR